MIYNLEFKPQALKERLENPRVSKDKLSGYENVYKIKKDRL